MTALAAREAPTVAAWLARAASDPVLAACARGLDAVLVVEVGDGMAALRLSEAPALVATVPPGTPAIAVRGPAAAFEAILSTMPPPGSQSYGAVRRLNGDVAVDADPLLEAQALAALERIFELARDPVPEPPSAFTRDDDSIVGRSAAMAAMVDGRPTRARIAWLEAGRGAPLVLLHTAGADARQYRHQLADRALQSRYRMVAFDLPWHGSSSGTDGSEAPEPYILAEAEYLAWCVAVLEALDAPATVVGCSMGAAMALTLAARRPDLVSGVVALEAPLRAPGRRSPLLSHACVAGARHNPSYVRALLSPTAPQVRRDEACAIYAQARPGIYEGDLAYYSDEYDGAAVADGVARCGRPVALLTGAYDYSASPESTRALVEAIGAERVHFRVMDNLGHFPMIEDPDRFRPHFMEALRHVSPEAP
ncbi:alpha/beta fold hydrolase [Acuticoccus sp.]|uniref:alpha/beta fold hydrolase n=1 Tax=Acuticoccus sp. TaxID=1904378 RepID=UPI003B52D6F7